MNKIKFYDNSHNQIRIERKKIRKIIEIIFIEEGFDYELISLIFCDDEYLLNLNRKFLKHDFYTDILTFDISDTQSIAGELYISMERIKENAKKFNVKNKVELSRVIIHGILHLLKYKDKFKNEKIIMREKEDYYLGKLDEEIK